jgi:glycosyltransferase involved in cell wall biosynthesis
VPYDDALHSAGMHGATLDVSVVMPVFNGAQFIAEAIESILGQTLLPGELIVVDDGSVDESAALVQEITTTATLPIRYTYQSNQGAGAARNCGIGMAAGSLIAFLDQDDVWSPDKLAHQTALLHQNPEAGYATACVEFFLEPGITPPAWVRPERLQGPQPSFLPSCLVVRKATFARIGCFDPALRISNDTDWVARAKEAGVIPVVAQAALVRHRIHAGNHSRFVGDVHQDLHSMVRKALLRKRAMSPAGPDADQ